MSIKTVQERDGRRNGTGSPAAEVSTSRKTSKKSKEQEGEKPILLSSDIDDLTQKIQRSAENLATAYGCKPYSLLQADITNGMVDHVYQDLRKLFPKGNEKLLVVVYSGGGDIDAAFNIAKLFRRYGSSKLLFAVPRFAKSAATLLVCGGDEILM